MEPEPEVVFISVFNLGAIELAKNHLESLKRQNIDNYLAFCTDKESFDILQEEGYHVEYFSCQESIMNTDISKEKEDFGSKSFDDITFFRHLAILKLLKEGKAVWYMDVDTVVLSDLNLVYKYYATNMKKYDIILQDDINMACLGCMLCFPTEKTVEMLETTYNRRNDGFNDQILFNKIVQEKGSSSETGSQENIKLLLLNRMEFPNGLLVFHPKHPNPQLAKLQEDFRTYRSGGGRVYFVHANWMVGIDTKISALKTLGAWFL